MKTRDSESLRQAELTISYLLRYGVLLCGAIIALGMFLMLYQAALQPQSASFLDQAHSDPAGAASHVPRDWPTLKAALAQADGNAVAAVGLLLLILLPVLRVAATVVTFIIERDYFYFSITLFVLIILVTGLVLGKSL